jgi:arylsulfatase A-like enzyme
VIIRILIIFICCSAANADSPNKPNIIWMIADDIGYDIKAFNNNYAITPSLDRLAREGVQFWRFYTPSAVCSPSRVGFSTGQHPAELSIYSTLHSKIENNITYNGVEGIPSNIPTIFEILADNGYRTAHVGKWHKGSIQGFGPKDKGIDEIFSYDMPENIDGKNRSDELFTLFHQGPTAYYSQLDTKLTDWAIDFVDRTDEPFFMEISFNTPHNPLYPTEKELEEFTHLQGSLAPEHIGIEDPLTTPGQRYYSAVKSMDDNIGRLMTKLRQRGIEENTIIMFSGDNGPGTQRNPTTSFNAYGSTGPFRGNKGTIYEGGIRVPFIAKGPGFAKNVDIHEAISGTDIVPSLLAVLGINSAVNFYGENMSPMFYGNDLRRTKPIHWLTIQNKAATENVANRSPVLGMYDPGKDIKCLMQPNGGRKEVYRTKMTSDPAELNNLHMSSPDLASSCFNDLETWYKSLPPPKKFRKGAGKLYHYR